MEYDLTKIAADYHLQTTNTRPQIAKNIISQYLTLTSTEIVQFSADPRSLTPAQIIKQLKHSLNNASPSLFNDLHLLVYETLAKHYHGSFVDYSEAVFSGPVIKRTKFQESVFYQMYHKDKGKFRLETLTIRRKCNKPEFI